MKDKLRVVMTVLLTAALVLMVGGFWFFVAKQAETEMAQEEASAIEAMYIEYGGRGDKYVFVQQGTDLLFYGEIPSGQLYDESDRKLSEDKLVTGDILKIYGDGIMTKSYPGQYPGITRMKRIHMGYPEDAEQYDELLEGLTGKTLYSKEEGIMKPDME
ncbi:MAG: hypothetical protein Q4C91_09880 [Eubacteriales bacterium]|nr:hypothetical protein [Eubacteriales bacterium]